MQRHEDVVLNQIGTPIPGVIITVRVQNVVPGAGALATIYSDDGTTVISGSAVTTNTFGRFFFFAPDGKYDLTATGSGITTYTLADIEIADVTESFSSDLGWVVDTKTVGIWNNIRVVDGVKFATTQEAIDDLPASGGRVLVVQSETLTSPITFPNDNIELVCAGGGAAITYTVSTAARAFDLTGRQHITIRNPHISLTSATPTEGILMGPSTFRNFIFNVQVFADTLRSGQHGIRMNDDASTGVLWNRVENCMFNAVDVGVFANGANAAGGVNDNVFAFNQFVGVNKGIEYQEFAIGNSQFGDTFDDFAVNAVDDDGQGNSSFGGYYEAGSGATVTLLFGSNSTDAFYFGAHWNSAVGRNGLSDLGVQNQYARAPRLEPSLRLFQLNSSLQMGLNNITSVNDVSGRRYKATGGTALVAGDFALSSGWGTTATVSSVSGTDQRFRITVTSAGTGQSANPTITLTFKNGTWTTVPFANTTRGGGSQPTVSVDVTSTTATTLVATFNGTPVAAETYDINCIVMG